MSAALIILGTAVIAFPAGFILCAALSHTKVQDAIDFWNDGAEVDKLRAEVTEWVDHAAFAANEATVAQDAHSRAADALLASYTRINRALEQVTPGANATVQRIARILKGEA